MKVAILAGGRGTRLQGKTASRPKAMVEIGERPILWHVMQIYAGAGLTDFVIALGHKGEIIQKELPHLCADSGWNVTLVDTGEHTQSAGRVLRLKPYLGDDTFCLTWCDGLADIDINASIAFHRGHGKLATVSAVHPPARFGSLELDGARVTQFAEKRIDRSTWISGAFFVLEPRVLGYIDGDSTPWEGEPLENLVRDGELMAYGHEGFWQCMDTAAEHHLLNDLWREGKAPWKVGR